MVGMIIPYKGVYPTIHEGAFIAETAVIIGDVTIGAKSNIWYGCVLRGDVNRIEIGEGTNIQDGTVIHTSSDDNPMGGAGLPTIIGDRVTVGHLALLHACTVGDDCLVGMKACAMDGSSVASHSILAAGAVLTPGKSTHAGELWSGIPAVKQRAISDSESQLIAWTWKHYIDLANEYKF